jgi:hypothetical protein
MKCFRPQLTTVTALAILLTVFAFTQALAANYFVSIAGNDANQGTEDQPWRTIGKAGNTLAAGDIVYVQTGTYPETVTISASGSAGNYISYIAQGTVKVKNWIVNSKNYIVLDGFTNDPTTYNLGNYNFFVQVIGTSSYITVRNFTLTMPNGVGGVCQNESGHIKTGTGTSYVTIDNNTLVGSCYYPAINWGGSHQTYSNNTIHDFYTDAFAGEGPFYDSTVSGNEIYNIYDYGYHSDCYQIFSDHGGITQRIIIENNICRDGEAQAMFLTADGYATEDITFRNNIWYNIRIAGGIGMPKVKFYNNVFWKSGWDSAYALDFNANSIITAGAEVKNNFFIGCGSGQTPDYGTGYSRPYTETGGSNNYYAKAPTAGVPWGPQYFGTPEPGYINGGDPKFLDYTTRNFRPLSGSPAIDKGTAIPQWSNPKDRSGASRPAGGGWDIGCYEYIAGGALSPPSSLRVVQ